MAEQGRQWVAMGEAERQAFGAGSYLAAVKQRAADTAAQLTFMAIGGWMLLAMFLFGSWFVRSGVIRDPGAHLPLFRRLRNLGLLVGLPLMLWSTWTHPTMTLSEMNFGIAAAQSATLLANLLMCLGYMSIVVLAMQTPAWSRRLGWLAPAGRMALTNYLMQSIVCTAIFYGYGLGYFERLPRAWQPLFVVSVFALQVVFSRWWLSRYRYGPMEWLWRWITYGQSPTLRLATAS